MIVTTLERSRELSSIRQFNRDFYGDAGHPTLPQEGLVLVNVLTNLLADINRLRSFYTEEIKTEFPSSLKGVKYLPESFFIETRQTMLKAFHNKERFEAPSYNEWRLIISQHPDFLSSLPTMADLMSDDEDAVLGAISPVAGYTVDFINGLYLSLCDKYLQLKIKGYNY
jgi:hypothetical protein